MYIVLQETNFLFFFLHSPVASRLLQYGHPSCQIIVDFGMLGFEKWRRIIHNGMDERLKSGSEDQEDTMLQQASKGRITLMDNLDHNG